MSKGYDNAIYRGYTWTRDEDTYDEYPDIDSGDGEIKRFVEKKRREYYEAWFAYIAEFA